MKKIITIMAIALLSGVAVNAQDDSAHLKKHMHHSAYDSMPNPADSASHRKWHKDKMPKDRKKNWPDSSGRAMPDSLRKPD
jgi:hypothetical protein